jgi:hypothetical protein
MWRPKPATNRFLSSPLSAVFWLLTSTRPAAPGRPLHHPLPARTTLAAFFVLPSILLCPSLVLLARGDAFVLLIDCRVSCC